MAENKKSFVLYADLIHTVRKMPRAKRGDLFMTILEYVNDENPVVTDTVVDLVFEPIKRQLKRDLAGWEKTIEKKSDSGILGNLKRWHNDLYQKVIDKEISLEESQNIAKHRTAIKNIANIAVTVTDTVTVTDINNINKKGAENFCFILKGETIKSKPYDFLMQCKGPIIEAWQMNIFRGIDTAEFENSFNLEYNGYNFNDENHLQNTAKALMKNIFNKKNLNGNHNNGTTKERPVAGRLTKSEIDRFDADTARLAEFIKSGNNDIGI